MPEESTTPDLVERWQQAAAAVDSGDYAAFESFFAPGAVWDATAGLGMTFEGTLAIRRFMEDWVANFWDYGYTNEEAGDVGNGVIVAASRLDGRPLGSAGAVQERWCFTVEWDAGMIVRVTAYRDIDEARAAAERLAHERE